MLAAMRDLRRRDVNILTLGQYLRPVRRRTCRWPAIYTPDGVRRARARGPRPGITARAGEPADPLVLPRLGAGASAPTAGAQSAVPPMADTATTSRARARLRGRRPPPAASGRCCSSGASRRRRARRTPSARSAGSATSTSARKRSPWAPSRRCAPDDYIMTSYREHGQALARGMSARAVMAELFGKATGCSARQGRLDAPLRRLARLPRRPRHRGRAHPARDRRGVRHQVPGRRPGRGLLLRRGRGQQRRVPRGAQHGRAVEAAAPSTSARTTATGWARRSSARRAIYDIAAARLLLRHGGRGGGRDGRARRAGRRWTGRRSARASARRRRCSRSAPTASWATRCPTRSTGTTAPRTRSRRPRRTRPDRTFAAKLNEPTGCSTTRPVADAGGGGRRRGGGRGAASPTRAPDPDPAALTTDVYAEGQA